MNTEPVPVPMLTNLLVDAIAAANEAEGKRPKAFDTMFRHSDAGKCARQMGFSYLEVQESDPMDLAGHWVTWVGQKVHEEWQEVLIAKYGERVNLEVEKKVRRGDLSSGHLDALVDTQEGVTICFELKTRGSFGFDKAMGYRRKGGFRREYPEGPRRADIIQGSLNAVAAGADLLVIGIIGMEALSKAGADTLGTSDLERIMGEWHYRREEFEPIALAEWDRMEEIKGYLDRDTLPPRWGISDSGFPAEFNPAHTNFPCGYCPYKSACLSLGAQPVTLSEARFAHVQ